MDGTIVPTPFKCTVAVAIAALLATGLWKAQPSIKPTLVTPVAVAVTAEVAPSISGAAEAVLPQAEVELPRPSGPAGGWGYYGTPMQVGTVGLTLWTSAARSEEVVFPQSIRLTDRPSFIYIAPPEASVTLGGHFASAVALALASPEDSVTGGGSIASTGLPRTLEGEDPAIVDSPNEAGLPPILQDGGLGGFGPPTDQPHPIPLPPAATMGGVGLGIVAAVKRLRAML